MTSEITREQALCMLFCLEHNEENIKELTTKLKDMKDIDICYQNDPLKPILLPPVRINSNPFIYLRYTNKPLTVVEVARHSTTSLKVKEEPFNDITPETVKDIPYTRGFKISVKRINKSKFQLSKV